MQAKIILCGFILCILSLNTWAVQPALATDTSHQDFDQDGLTDVLELQLKTDSALSDTDGDGFADGIEVGTNPKAPKDSDQDSIIDALDWDDDGDRIPTVLESKEDHDHDGLADYLDTDSDNDGKSDTEEAGLTGLDGDHDRIDDAFDADLTGGNDQNGDGVDDQILLADAVTTFIQEPVLAAEPNANSLKLNPITPLEKSTEMLKSNPVIEVEVSETAALSLLINPASQAELDHAKVAKRPDTDGDHLPDELEIGLDPKHPADTDGDGIFDFLDEDDDGDYVLSLIEGELDRDGDGRVNYLDVDESGYFYCATNGRIVSGIKDFKIIPSADVVLTQTAQAGRYRWYPKKPGTYTLQFTLPKGLRTVTELEKGQLYVTSANGNLVNLGWSEDINQEGQLARFNIQQLPLWYSSFVIQEGAPAMINHNIPLMGGECDSP